MESILRVIRNIVANKQVENKNLSNILSLEEKLK